MSKKNHIRISTGRLVDPFNLTFEDFENTDFTHAISCINRFTGHAKYPYSVGQHTVALTLNVPEHLQRAAFIHDFSEVYFNDIASPVKKRFKTYRKHETAAQQMLFDFFQVPWADMEELDEYDKRIFMNERNILFHNIKEDGQGMGDDRISLDIHEKYFREMTWRDVRHMLDMIGADLFPQYDKYLRSVA